MAAYVVMHEEGIDFQPLFADTHGRLRDVLPDDYTVDNTDDENKGFVHWLEFYVTNLLRKHGLTKLGFSTIVKGTPCKDLSEGGESNKIGVGRVLKIAFPDDDDGNWGTPNSWDVLDGGPFPQSDDEDEDVIEGMSLLRRCVVDGMLGRFEWVNRLPPSSTPPPSLEREYAQASNPDSPYLVKVMRDTTYVWRPAVGRAEREGLLLTDYRR